jgi:transcriptional regulator with XRE-family HTH domain
MGPLAIAKKPRQPAGEFLREVRAAYGISQAGLATRASTTQSAISRIESGKVSPSFDTLRELLRLLGADLVLEATPREGGPGPTLGQLSGADPFDPAPLLHVLDRKEVDFVVIGGVAGIAHGSVYPTDDLDLAYARGRRNLERLAGALRDLGARPPDAPADRPFRVDAQALEGGMDFTFIGDGGRIDLFGRVGGAEGYTRLRVAAEVRDIGGVMVPVAPLDRLIGMKRRQDGPRDEAMLDEYVAIDRRRRGRGARR